MTSSRMAMSIFIAAWIRVNSRVCAMKLFLDLVASWTMLNQCWICITLQISSNSERDEANLALSLTTLMLHWNCLCYYCCTRVLFRISSWIKIKLKSYSINGQIRILTLLSTCRFFMSLNIASFACNFRRKSHHEATHCKKICFLQYCSFHKDLNVLK